MSKPDLTLKTEKSILSLQSARNQIAFAFGLSNLLLAGLLSLLAGETARGQILAIGVVIAFLFAAGGWLLAERIIRSLREPRIDGKQFFNLSVDMLCVAGTDGYFKHLNPAFERTLGYSREALLAKPFLEFVHPDDRPTTQAKLAEMASGKTVSLFRNRYRCRDGSYKWLEWTSVPAEGRLYAVARDVTEQKELVANLAAEKQLRETILDSLPGIFYVFDETGRFLRWNENFAAVTGWTSDEIGKMNSLDFFAGPDKAYIATRIEMVFREGAATAEADLVSKNGRTTPYFLTGRRMILRGKPCLVGTGIDISERKKMEERLRQSEANMRALFNNTLQAFILFSPERRVLALNAVANEWGRQILGRPLQKGDHADELFAQFEQTSFQQAFAEALQGKPSTQQRGIEVGAQTFCFETNYIPAVTEEGTVIGVALSVLDITKRKQTEAELRASEERFRLLVEGVRDYAIYMLDPDGTIVSWNKGAERIKGYKAEEVIGRSFSLFYKPADREKGKPAIALQNATRRGRHQDEGWRMRQDGALFWANVALTALRAENGELRGFAKVTRDMTEQKKAEEALRQSQAQLSGIIASAMDAIITINEAQEIVLFNQAAETMFAYMAEEIKGQSLEELIPPHFRARHRQHVHHFGRSGVTKRSMGKLDVLYGLRAGGEEFPIEASISQIEVDGEKLFTVVLRDITERVQAQEERERLRAHEQEIQQRVQRQERMAAVGQLAAGIAHDFNNILAVITLHTQLVLHIADLDRRPREKLRTIEQQAERASDLIQQILDFSRQSVLKRQSLNLLPFLSELTRLLSRTLPENIRVELNYDEGEFVIHADPARIQQAMMNLAFNARDAMTGGGRLSISLMHISLSAEASPPITGVLPGRWVCIEITDEGVGIPPEQLDHVFEPFFTTKEIGQGTGLGLAQVYGIVQQHDGHIEVEAEVGQGATFRLYFPALVSPPGETQEASSASLPSGQRQRILVVEDDPATRGALVDGLSLLNYEPVEAANGREALQILTDQPDQIDLILSDVVMPEMDGITLLRSLRQRELTIPVVMVTGHPLHEEMETLQTQELTGWLSKPPTLAELAELLTSVFSDSSTT